MKDTASVSFERTAHVSGKDHSWAKYRWIYSENHWRCIAGDRSENFYHNNPEFTPIMDDARMTLYSLRG